MKIFVLANREHIRGDVEASFPGDTIAHFLFKADMKPFLETAVDFGKAVVAGSAMGEKVRVVLAGPTAIAFILGQGFAHSSRSIIFSFLDLDAKKYVDLDLSDHMKVHF